MRDRTFLDTNIFVYSFDEGNPRKQGRARELIEKGLRDGSVVISYQVVQEFLNVALKKFAQPLTVPEAQLYLANILHPLCVISSSTTLFDLAIRVANRYTLAFYDSLIVASALESQCKVLLSEDLHDGLIVEGELSIRNPF